MTTVRFKVRVPYRFVAEMEEPFPEARMLKENDIPSPPPNYKIKDLGENRRRWVTKIIPFDIPYWVIFLYRCLGYSEDEIQRKLWKKYEETINA